MTPTDRLDNPRVIERVVVEVLWLNAVEDFGIEAVRDEERTRWVIHRIRWVGQDGDGNIRLTKDEVVIPDAECTDAGVRAAAARFSHNRVEEIAPCFTLRGPAGKGAGMVIWV